MKAIIAIFLSIILFSMGYYNHSEVYAGSVRSEKQSILEDLELLKENSNFDKKSIKSIEKAILSMENALNPKNWDDDLPNLMKGDKIFSEDRKAGEKLNEILKDKKETQENKDKINKILFRLTSISSNLVETTLTDTMEIVMDEKTMEKLDDAQQEFEKGNLSFSDSDFVKALNQFEKAWKKIEKALKEPHTIKMETVDEVSGSLDFDNINDIYLKIENPEKSTKPIKIDIKIRDACVNGITHNDAIMKMAFMGPGKFITNERLTDEGFNVSNKWFKKNDENKQIDRFTEIISFFIMPITGDDMIQISSDENIGSFDYNEVGIAKIGNQTGWEGSIKIEGNPGEYEMVLFFPLTSPTSTGDDCNIISAISIPFEIKPSNSN